MLQFLFGGTCSEQQGCERLKTSLRMKFSAARCCKNGFLRPALEVLLLLGAESFATSRMTKMDATHLRQSPEGNDGKFKAWIPSTQS